ncbi:MAG TPA: P-II family nitrogen regulator [Candidatus Omnitrophota bacterium]|nr:P-II family nitrogen regulator [Candidatus Omnitrophota bacterium]
MKRIEAIVRPGKVGEICTALRKIGNQGLMIMEIEGYGKQHGVEQQFRGKTYKTELLNKARLEVIARDEDLDIIVKTIKSAAYTGKEGDGKIFISSIENAIKVRTGEEGDKAL